MSHPAVKIKKQIQLPAESTTSSQGRRPSGGAPSQSDSLGYPEQQGFNPNRRRSTYRPGGANAQSLMAAVNFRRMTRASIQGLPLEGLLKQAASVKYENTYKMEPDKEFMPSKAKAKVSSLLEQHMADMTYDPVTAGHLAETIADGVKNVVKTLDCPRHKIVSNVVIGPCCKNSMQTASRCLWNEHTDSFTCVTHKNNSMYAIVTIFAVYFE